MIRLTFLFAMKNRFPLRLISPIGIRMKKNFFTLSNLFESSRSFRPKREGLLSLFALDSTWFRSLSRGISLSDPSTIRGKVSGTTSNTGPSHGICEQSKTVQPGFLSLHETNCTDVFPSHVKLSTSIQSTNFIRIRISNLNVPLHSWVTWSCRDFFNYSIESFLEILEPFFGCLEILFRIFIITILVVCTISGWFCIRIGRFLIGRFLIGRLLIGWIRISRFWRILWV